MFKNNRVYLVVITGLFAVLIAINHYAPKPIDWTTTYNINERSPYSCYVLNDMLGLLFPGQIIETNEECFYVTLDSDNAENKNIIVITTDFKPDKYDLSALLNFVADGNEFFVSSPGIGRSLLDTLKIKLESPIIDTSVYRSGKETLFLLNPELRNDSGYRYNKKMPLAWLSSFDTINTVKLGTNRNGNVNFICTKYGLGKIYIHTQPLVFTNYHLLYGNVEYASKVLSFLPIRKTILDNYYKPDRFINTSPVRYILSQPPLKSAYYLLLLTLLLYLVVESKRRQRVIPVVKPPENRSLQFVKTIGSLYFKQRNNADLAKKKTIYFKEFLREHYFLTKITSSAECVAIVSAKSGVAISFVRQILEITEYYEATGKVSDDGLIELNRKMEMFYKQCL